MDDLERIADFLPCPTPQAWLDEAVGQLPTLLIDHANCEKKAAGTALTLIHRYPADFDRLNRLSRLAREELRHFEQVIALMERRGIAYRTLSAARYASRLHREIRSREPLRRVDTLIVGAIIEARSCERFARLAPHLDDELGDFYRSLLKSEARHYRNYLALAVHDAGEAAVAARSVELLAVERRLIETPDDRFRFHSGPPS